MRHTCMMLLHSAQGVRPVRHSHRTQPNEYTSARSSTLPEEKFSGAMYATVPSMAYSWGA